MTLSKQHREAAEVAVEAAWLWFRKNKDAPFAAVVEQARRRCPSIAPESVQAAFEERWSKWRRSRRR
jgi:hypothetical protein